MITPLCVAANASRSLAATCKISLWAPIVRMSSRRPTASGDVRPSLEAPPAHATSTTTPASGHRLTTRRPRAARRSPGTTEAVARNSRRARALLARALAEHCAGYDPAWQSRPLAHAPTPRTRPPQVDLARGPLAPPRFRQEDR